MPIHKDIGFVLKSYDFRRSSKIAVFYTLHYGKLTGIFKAFRTKSDKFVTSLDLFTLNEFIFYDKKGPVWLVTETTLLDSFEHLKMDLNAFYAASYMVSFLDAAVPLHAKNEEIFHLFHSILSLLSTAPSATLIMIFQLKMMTHLGWYPSLLHCVRCDEEIHKNACFSIAKGGLLCPKCKEPYEAYMLLRQETLLVLRYILNYNFPYLLRIKISEAAAKEVRSVLDQFIEYHIHPHLIPSAEIFTA
jgi:DNA repair protein RecO (recombination protein O)